MEIKDYIKLDDSAQIEGYESPIHMYMEEIKTEIQKAGEKLDEECFNAVLYYGIDVDKAELIKALQYDRGQYDKGYTNGYAAGQRDAVKHGHWKPVKCYTGVEACGYKEETVEGFRCSICGEEIDVSEGYFHYCPACGAKMDEVSEDE